MKYPQLGHMPGDVEHWLEEQLEAQGVYGVICAKYILDLLIEISKERRVEYISNNSVYKDNYENKKCCQAYCSRQSWDADSFKYLGVVHYPMSAIRESLDIYKIVDELCIKLRKIQENGIIFYDTSKNYKKKFTLMDTPIVYSDATLNGNFISVNKTHSLPSCNSLQIRGKFHDPQSSKDQYKMEDYFSTLFFENPSDSFGYEFTRIKSGERQDGMECDRIKFYNRKNLLASENSERLYKRNSDIDKLIAKFDSNIEDLWKPPYGSENLNNRNYEHLFSENIVTNSSLLNGPNFIWSYGQNERDLFDNVKLNKSEEKINKYESTLLCNTTFGSPDFIPSNSGISAMLDSVNLTLAKAQKWSAMDGQNDTCNVSLNHKRDESCFAEVIPKISRMETNQNMDIIVPKEVDNANCESEDLLTSAKTHFRPIRMEDAQASQVVAFADGASFSVSDELDKVKFTRSNSGVLYLDTDGELETPRKYMEFKKEDLNEINTNIDDSENENDLSIIEKFVPKFRVRQSNEKFCQTEDLTDDDQIVPSFQETDCESDSFECDADEFYFPGDSELAEKIINKIDNCKLELKKIKSDCNYNDIYLINNTEKNTLQINANTNHCICDNGKNWASSTEFQVKQDLGDIWCTETTADAGSLKGEELPSTDKYFRFREELIQEGEQLLSDLSCLQQLYSSSEWGDDESAQVLDVFDKDEVNDNFCSLEFFNKFKNSKNNMSWENFWITKNENSLKNSQDNITEDKAASSVDLKENPNLKLNETNERLLFIGKSSHENKRGSPSSQKSYMFHTEHCYLTNEFNFCNTNFRSLISDASDSNENSYETAKNQKQHLSF